MRIVYLIISFLIIGTGGLMAQTNASTNGVGEILALATTNRPASPPKMAHGPTMIDASGPAEFDLTGHLVTYCNHVVVTDPQMKLTCEWLEASLPQGGEHITNIVAETNVVVDFTNDKGQKLRALGDKAVYSFHVENGVTNESVTLTGHPPTLIHGPDTMTGDAIIWNRITGKVIVTDSKGVFWNTNSASGTNSAKDSLL